MTTKDFTPGGYRYIPAVFQFSSGVAALPGFTIERVTFRRPLPLAEGFTRIERLIREAGRPLTAFCACELRSPAPWDEAGFRGFNEQYVVTLKRWGLFEHDDNPVARTNVCPDFEPPGEPSFHAFSFTVPATNVPPSFVTAGTGEVRGGPGSFQERTVRHGDTSPDAMREKTRFVLDALAGRMQQLGVRWSDATATQLYTVHDIYPFLADDIVRSGAARPGLTWHFTRPPVRDLDIEIDCRAVATERVV